MKLLNKRAQFDFGLLKERFEAGISLRGIEVKSLRDGRGDISNSYIKVLDDEIYLVNAYIPATQGTDSDDTRLRKLLLHRSEILSLVSKIKQEKLVIVPLKLYNKGRLIKVEFALGKSKRKFEKKELIKKRDVKRDVERELREARM